MTAQPRIVTNCDRKWVVTRIDDVARYVRFRNVLCFWEDDLDDATKFDTEADAAIAIRRHYIPYAKPLAI